VHGVSGFRSGLHRFSAYYSQFKHSVYLCAGSLSFTNGSEFKTRLEFLVVVFGYRFCFSSKGHEFSVERLMVLGCLLCRFRVRVYGCSDGLAVGLEVLR